MNDCAYGAELHFLKMHQRPVDKSVFPDVDFAPMPKGLLLRHLPFGVWKISNRRHRRLVHRKAPLFLDCKINADVAGSFMSELAAFEGGQH
ncbi:MAG: hypothetical protein CM1200mP18_19700 [Gammaproteobacteria bacterium]|nr:MAG: hypothetical protein CM1200mP18_19700 [Gammaproteobacteria bacterium]